MRKTFSERIKIKNTTNLNKRSKSTTLNFKSNKTYAKLVERVNVVLSEKEIRLKARIRSVNSNILSILRPNHLS